MLTLAATIILWSVAAMCVIGLVTALSLAFHVWRDLW